MPMMPAAAITINPNPAKMVATTAHKVPASAAIDWKRPQIPK